MNIGKRLKRVRELKGLTQLQMAELLGIETQQSYSRYEKKDSLDINKVKRFSKILGVDLLKPDFIETEEEFENLVLNEDAIQYKKTATTQEELLQLKALTKTITNNIAKINAKLFGVSFEDALNEIEQDTILNLKQLLT